jgi:short-subunit dehydrogenase
MKNLKASINQRIWFITGISSGLGKALAESVIESGDFVIGTFRKQYQVDEFLKANSGKAHAILLDITNHNAIEKEIGQIMTQFSRIDVLVNNAGVGFAGGIEETSMEECRKVMEVNFFSVLKMTQVVLPIMRKQESGHIVQISSHGGLKAFAGFGIYNASKFALEGFSEALAEEIKPLGIKLILVESGPFRTNFAGNNLGLAKKVIADYETTARVFRKKLKSVHAKQEGDPYKAAKAIMEMVNSKNPSLRLPLGKIALMTIGSKMEQVKLDLEKNKEVAEYAIFE